MINHINWHSVEKDGWPTKKGIYLIARGTNELEDSLCIDCLYSTDPPEWSLCTLEEITHYIPIDDISMPKAKNGGAVMLVNSRRRKYYFQWLRKNLGEMGKINLINPPQTNQQNTNTAS